MPLARYNLSEGGILRYVRPANQRITNATPQPNENGRA